MTAAPPNDAQHTKSQTIRLRVSPAQKAQLQQAAAQHHLSLSAWLRQLALTQIGGTNSTGRSSRTKAVRPAFSGTPTPNTEK